jgi:hypothetical protein
MNAVYRYGFGFCDHEDLDPLRKRSVASSIAYANGGDRRAIYKGAPLREMYVPLNDLLRARGEGEEFPLPDVDMGLLEEELDDFWSWVQERRHPASGGRTGQYVDSGHGGRAAVLDSYGDWTYVPRTDYMGVQGVHHVGPVPAVAGPGRRWLNWIGYALGWYLTTTALVLGRLPSGTDSVGSPAWVH